MYLAMCLVWLGTSGAMIAFQLYFGIVQRAGIASVRLALTGLLLWWVASGSMIGRWIMSVLWVGAALMSFIFAALVAAVSRGSAWFIAAFIAMGLFCAVFVLSVWLPTPVRTYLNRRDSHQPQASASDTARP